MLATWIEAGGQGATWGPGPRGDVVVGRRRDPPDRGQPGGLARAERRRRPDRPLAGILGREQGGQQPLARADPAPGGERPAPLSRQGGVPGGVGGQPVPGRDRPAQPARPGRVVRGRPARPRGARGQPDDDGPGGRAGGDARRLLPHRRAALRRPARRGGAAAEPVALPRDRRRPGHRPAARLVRRAAGLGGVPALSRGHQPADDRAALAARADPGAGHRLRRQGGLPAPDRRRDRDARPVHQAVPGGQRRPRAHPRRLRGLRPGRGQRRDRRARPELARPGPDPPGDQPGARPRQPQARPRRHRRVRHRPGRPGGGPVRADRPE